MKTITTLIFLFAATLCHAQLKPVEQASTLKFTIKNLGFDVDGSFSGFSIGGKAIRTPIGSAS